MLMRWHLCKLQMRMNFWLKPQTIFNRQDDLFTFTAMTGIEDHIWPGVVQTGLVSPNLPSFAEHPVLVTPLVMAWPQPHTLVKILSLGRAVHTLVWPLVSWWKCIKWMTRKQDEVFWTSSNWWSTSLKECVQRACRELRQSLEKIKGTTWAIKTKIGCSTGWRWISEIMYGSTVTSFLVLLRF